MPAINVPADIAALTFDIFGTCVDWRGSLLRECAAFGREAGVAADWEGLADDWRRGYAPALDRVRAGELRYMNLDELNLVILDEILHRQGLEFLSADQRRRLNLGWRRLDPWPDVAAGLRRLKRRFVIAPLSNGTIATLTGIARHGDLPWDCVLSSELAACYKWDPAAYQMAARLLQLPPNRILMVAAHGGDLRAARKVGLRTAFVGRPLEYGPHPNPDLPPDPSFDLIVDDFIELAERLGC
jgi:2-haloacid dehalogenase